MLGTSRSKKSATPESVGSLLDLPSATYAGLTLSSDQDYPPTDMSGSEKRDDGSVPPTAGSEARSTSPGVKRPASQISGPGKGVEMDVDAPGSNNAGPEAMDTSGADGDATNGGSNNVYPTSSSMSTYTAPTATRRDSQSQAASGATQHVPSIDDQVAQVTLAMSQPLHENQKGYVLSTSWMQRVLSRSSTHGDKADKTATEGEVGPVDNTDIVLVTDPSASGLKDEAGEPFVPLRPGLQIVDDYDIVPQSAWDSIMQWYGLADQSPAIVRYAHNTAMGDSENIQYEVNPPVFTVLKLPNPSTGTTPQTLKDKSATPVKMLASRHTNFQKWLKEAKELANIDMSTKVRVWRVLGGLGSASASTTITPAASRSASPAPTASAVANAGNNLVLDLNTFLSLSEGAQRELLEDARDQTANPNYNGRMTLDVAGLGSSDVLVLEENVGGAKNIEWVSEASKQTLNRLGVSAAIAKNGGAANKAKNNNSSSSSGGGNNKSPTTSGRTSPVPDPNRGRRRKDGKFRGNTGLSNLGNTCYMNSALQCVRSVEELAYYFLSDVYKKDLNPSNPLAHNGEVAKSYANLLRLMYDENGQSSFAPRQLKNTIGRYGPAFSGYGQQDSQEFLLFLLDGLQEDLNKILKKPYIEKPDSTDEMMHNRGALTEFAEKCWDIYKARNDSVVTDLFAGMYKSTLHCPVCDKFSIIFDPFNNLTLQLPIENLWSKKVYYFGLGKRPVTLDVEIDKNSSIKALKDLVAKKMGTDTERVVMSEIYKHKFYRIFDNANAISDCNINQSDDLAFFEAESVPTNYDADKPPRGYFSFGRQSEKIPSFDSPKADRLLLPVFHRMTRSKNGNNNNRNVQRQICGVPSYIIVNRDEAFDYDAILRKLLAVVDTMTTRDVLNEPEILGNGDEEGTNEDSDTVVMNEDDAESGDSKVKSESVDGEDGMVDVSMRDASDDTDAAATPSPATTGGGSSANSTKSSTVSSGLKKLFEVKVTKGGGEVIPTGFNTIDDNKEYISMSSRIKALEKAKQAEADATNESEKKEGEAESDQEGSANNNSSDSDASDMFSEEKRPQTPKQVDVRPLVRPGEGVILDWNSEAYDALFGGNIKDKKSLRGLPTWTDVEHVADPELAKKRALRQSRKKRGITLDECLDEFNKEEVLSENDAWYCPRCKEHRRASKKFELWKTPDILVMHLKRFSASRGFRDKLDVFVDFPVEGLDMTGRVEAPEPGESLVYDLFAVDNHYGGLGGGHYTAYAKNFMSGEWNEYNGELGLSCFGPL